MASMLTAQEAKEMVPVHRKTMFNKAIRDAVVGGNSCCFVRFRANPQELAMLQGLGYETNVTSCACTHIYWFNNR